MKKENKGFTLIEVMVVMAIIAVLATLVIGAVQLARRTATETTHRANAKTVQIGLESNFAKYRAYCGQPNEIACQAVGTNISFANVAGDTLQGISPAMAGALGTKIGSAACATGAAAATAGGGYVSIQAGGYTITPQNFDCSAILTNDVLSMP